MLSIYFASGLEQHVEVVLCTLQGRVELEGMEVGLLSLLILSPSVVQDP